MVTPRCPCCRQLRRVRDRVGAPGPIVKGCEVGNCHHCRDVGRCGKWGRVPRPFYAPRAQERGRADRHRQRAITHPIPVRDGYASLFALQAQLQLADEPSMPGQEIPTIAEWATHVVHPPGRHVGHAHCVDVKVHEGPVGGCLGLNTVGSIYRGDQIIPVPLYQVALVPSYVSHACLLSPVQRCAVGSADLRTSDRMGIPPDSTLGSHVFASAPPRPVATSSTWNSGGPGRYRRRKLTPLR